MKKILSLIILTASVQLSFSQDSTAISVAPTKYGQIPTPSGSNLRLSGGSWTIEAWVFVPASPLNQQMFVVETYGFSTTGGFLLRINSDFHLQAYQIEGPSSSVAVNGTTSVNLGEWNHIAACFNHTNSMLYLYLNGVQDASAACSIPTSNTNNYLNIGARGDDANIWQTIEIDEVRIWNVARSQSQIASTMNLCLAGDETGLIAYYNFEGQTTSAIADQTASANDGTITGFDASLLVDGVYDCIGNTLAVTEVESSEFIVYPNPVKTNLTVQTTENILSINIFNSAGTLVRTENKNTFSVESLPAGIYLMQIQTENETGKVRFIKD